MIYLLVFVLFLLVFNLRSRLEKVERLMQSGVAPVTSSSLPTETLVTNKETPASVPVASEGKSVSLGAVPTLQSPVNSKSKTDIIDWLRRDWLLKLGGLLILMAFGWLVSYAFINDWIGPMGRITVGLVAGAGLLGFGWQRMQKFVHQGSVFLVVGSTTILLTLYAARYLYDFFTPTSALVVMFLSVVVVAFASVSFRNKSLAIVGLILAGVAPLLTNASNTDQVGLFSYLMMVMLGTVWVVFVTKWRSLSLYALLLVTVYSAPHFLSLAFSPQRDLLLLLAFGFTAIIFLTNIVSLKKNIELPSPAEIAVIFGNGLFLILWVLVAGQKEWQSLLLSTWMVVFAGASFVVTKISGKREIFYAHGSVAVVMLVAATAVELDGPALTLAYIGESLLIPLVVALFSRRIETAMRSSIFIVGPMFLALGSYTATSWYKGVFHADFLVLLFVACGLMGLGLSFRRYLPPSAEKSYFQASNFYMISGSIYFYMLLWKALHAGSSSYGYGLASLGTMLSYLVYTSIGIVCYFQGHRLLRRGLWLYGGTLVLVVIVRLVLVDVWRMDLAGRVVTFFVLGGLLMGTAFVQSKKKEIKN